MEEIAGRDTLSAAARYGELNGTREFETSRVWAAAAVGLECTHNFDVTARMLLNGDLNFRPLWDFKELRVAKTARSATPA